MSLTPVAFKKQSSGEVDRKAKSVSSILLPTFGTTLVTEDHCYIKKYVIFPYDRRYRLWRAFLAMLVVYSAWASTFEVAFRKATTGALATVDLIVDFFFAIDIVLTFFVAYLDKSTYLMVDDHKRIALRYVGRLYFAMDVISTVPFQHLFLMATGRRQKAEVFAFLNLLRLWRIRHVNGFFKRLEKDIRFSYFYTRLLKLVGITSLVVHVGGCIMFYIAFHYKTPEETFIGAVVPDFKEKSMWFGYIFSVYWSIVTFATVGYGDVHSINDEEKIYNVAYMLLNMGINSFIFGNITNLIVSSAVRTLKMRHDIKEIVQYAKKNKLPEGLKEQMLAHMQLKYKTEELQQEGLLQDLPKAIKTEIHQHLFRSIVENAYLFKGISEDLIVHLVSEMKAEYFPPKVEIILQNEIPTDLYILVSGALDVVIHKNGMEQILTTLDHAEMAGEIGVMFNIPQPFTIRTKKLSQFIRLSHPSIKHTIQPDSPDGKIIITNFIEYLRNLEEDVVQELPFLPELLQELTVKQPKTRSKAETYEAEIAQKIIDPKEKEGTSMARNKAPIRVIIHGHHPSEGKERRGTLINLPGTLEDLLRLAEKKLGKRGSKILTDDGAEVEELDALRENDRLFIV